MLNKDKCEHIAMNDESGQVRWIPTAAHPIGRPFYNKGKPGGIKETDNAIPLITQLRHDRTQHLRIQIIGVAEMIDVAAINHRRLCVQSQATHEPLLVPCQ